MTRAGFLLLTAIALAAGCGGRSRETTPGGDGGTTDGRVDGDGCRSDDDCMSGTSWEYCLPPGTPPACGIGCMMMRECESHTDCGEGSRCIQYLGGCCTAIDPLNSRCLPACTETTCADGERCNTEGICEPIPCADGWSCPAYTSCTGTGDGHGCSRNACASDTDCAGGYCVNGGCYPDVGTCTPPSA